MDFKCCLKTRLLLSFYTPQIPYRILVLRLEEVQPQLRTQKHYDAVLTQRQDGIEDGDDVDGELVAAVQDGAEDAEGDDVADEEDHLLRERRHVLLLPAVQRLLADQRADPHVPGEDDADDEGDRGDVEDGDDEHGADECVDDERREEGGDGGAAGALLAHADEEVEEVLAGEGADGEDGQGEVEREGDEDEDGSHATLVHEDGEVADARAEEVEAAADKDESGNYAYHGLL